MSQSLNDLRAVALAHRRQRLHGPQDLNRGNLAFQAAWDAYLDRHPEIDRNEPKARAEAGGVVAQLLCEAVRRSGAWIYGGLATEGTYVMGPPV